MIDLGSGLPLVLIPGIQGRWEWMRLTVDALARRCRVITFSLCGEPGTGSRVDAQRGFENFVEQIDRAFDQAGLTEAAVCGVSFGGLVALHYAAVRPERVQALMLASTPGPTWRPECRVEWYVRAPRLLSPLFAWSSAFRLYPEIAAAFPRFGARLLFSARHLARVCCNPFSPVRMAQRVRFMGAVDFVRHCQCVKAPTLIVTGKPGLDRVVPVQSTRGYLEAIAGARYAMIDETGHIGLITKADRFAEVVTDFMREVAQRSSAEARKLA
jgi:pimeloyl-ACP methyl ester carboxylesterase